MKVPDLLELLAQRAFRHSRQYGCAVLRPLSAAHHNLPPLEVDVLHPQLQALVQPKPRPVQEQAHQPDLAIESFQQLPDLSPAQHDGYSLRLPRAHQADELLGWPAKHRPVQEEQRAEHLRLRSHRDLLLRREPGQERADLRGTQFGGMPHSMEPHEPANPADVRLLRALAVPADPERPPHLIGSRGRCTYAGLTAGAGTTVDMHPL